MEKGFVARGGLWVAAQVPLLAAVAVLAPYTGALLDGPLSLLAYALLAAGIALGAWSASALGRALTPYPRPLEGEPLRTEGPYRFVRHPIYSAVLLLAAGWALLWQSDWGALVLAALYVFFELKAAREERWLEETHAGYAAYRARVRKLIPWIR